jgi:hypothetical protein
VKQCSRSAKAWNGTFTGDFRSNGPPRLNLSDLFLFHYGMKIDPLSYLSLRRNHFEFFDTSSVVRVCDGALLIMQLGTTQFNPRPTHTQCQVSSLGFRLECSGELPLNALLVRHSIIAIPREANS